MLAGLAACAGEGGGSQEEREELAAFVQQMASNNGAEVTPEDVDFYMAHITDAFVQDFGGEDLAGCAADPEFCIGEPLPNASVSAEEVFIVGDTATSGHRFRDRPFRHRSHQRGWRLEGKRDVCP